MAETNAALGIPQAVLMLLIVGGAVYAVGTVTGHILLMQDADPANPFQSVTERTAVGSLIRDTGLFVAGAGMLWAAWAAQPAAAWYRVVYLVLGVALIFRILG